MLAAKSVHDKKYAIYSKIAKRCCLNSLLLSINEIGYTQTDFINVRFSMGPMSSINFMISKY